MISNYRAVKHEEVRRLAASSLSLRLALHVASWKEQLNLDATRRLYPLPAVCIIRLQRCFTLPVPANSLRVLGDNLAFPKKKEKKRTECALIARIHSEQVQTGGATFCLQIEKLLAA